MPIHLTAKQKQSIEAHGEDTFPNECCGFLLGTVCDHTKQVASLLQVDNAREGEAQHNRFLISPQDFMRAEKEARMAGIDVIGIYHSHPDDSARPSQYDRDHAWPWYSYLIVSIMNQQADHMYSWVLKEDRSAFDQEDIVLET